MNQWERLRNRVEQQATRMRKAEKDKSTLLAQTAYLGSLGLMFGIPVVAGAYLGNWLDDLCQGYSVRWTVGGILLGIVIGAFNIYLTVKE